MRPLWSLLMAWCAALRTWAGMVSFATDTWSFRLETAPSALDTLMWLKPIRDTSASLRYPCTCDTVFFIVSGAIPFVSRYSTYMHTSISVMSMGSIRYLWQKASISDKVVCAVALVPGACARSCRSSAWAASQFHSGSGEQGGGVKIRDNMCTGIDHNQSQGVYELARECVVGSRSMNPAKGIGDLFVLTCYMRVRNPDSIIGLKHPYGSRAFGQDRILSAT